MKSAGAGRTRLTPYRWAERERIVGDSIYGGHCEKGHESDSAGELFGHNFTVAARLPRSPRP